MHSILEGNRAASIGSDANILGEWDAIDTVHSFKRIVLYKATGLWKRGIGMAALFTMVKTHIFDGTDNRDALLGKEVDATAHVPSNHFLRCGDKEHPVAGKFVR